jgi:hypothetical protein
VRHVNSALLHTTTHQLNHYTLQSHITTHPTMALRTSTPDITIQRNRLPNLYEVLSRQTKPPVDLFSFYIYMRDAQRSVDYLDFWYTLTPSLG